MTTGDRLPMVTVRYWAAARAAAGLAEERLAGATLADVLTAAQIAHAESTEFPAVLKVCAFLVGDAPVGTREHRDVALSDDDVVEVLPPFAGG